MELLLAPIEHLEPLHAILGSALFFVLSSLCLVKILGKPRSEDTKEHVSGSIKSSRNEPTYSDQDVSRGGAKRLAPVADSVWYELYVIRCLR